MVVVDIDVGHPDISITVHAVEVILIDDHGSPCICIIPYVHVNPADIDIGHPVPREGLPRRSGSNTSPGAPEAPILRTRCHKSRTPSPGTRRSPRPGRVPGCGDGSGPVPLIAHQDPGSVVMRYVAEGLGRNPRLVPVPLGPASHGKRRPSGINRGRPPEPALPPFIGYHHPVSVLVEHVCIAPKDRRQVRKRWPPLPRICSPELIAVRIPRVPDRVDNAFTRGYLVPVRKDRRRAGRHVIPCVRGNVDKTDRAFHRDYFHGILAHIEIENRSGIGEHIPEGAVGFMTVSRPLL